VNTAKCQRIEIGNEITLADRQNIAYVKGVVIFRHEYDTIREMLQSERVKNICPFLNDNDLEKAVQMYQNLPEFFGAKKYRCVAFGLQIVESKL
jgi:ASC-1-like (ASCH) protein